MATATVEGFKQAGQYTLDNWKNVIPEKELKEFPYRLSNFGEGLVDNLTKPVLEKVENNPGEITYATTYLTAGEVIKGAFDTPRWAYDAGQNYVEVATNPSLANVKQAGIDTAMIAMSTVGGKALLGKEVKTVAVEEVASARTTVLGRHPTYLEKAKELNANNFNLPPEVWSKIKDNSEKVWEANKKFLDRAIARGDDIVLASDPYDVGNKGSYFIKEIDYLKNNGYKITDDGKKMVKVK